MVREKEGGGGEEEKDNVWKEKKSLPVFSKEKRVEKREKMYSPSDMGLKARQC